MSIMCVRIALLLCFAVSSTLTLIQDSAEESEEFEVVDTGSSRLSIDRGDRFHSFDPKKSLLAGEDTPVWIASYPNPNSKFQLAYERLERGIVKQAIDYWKSSEFQGITKPKGSNLRQRQRDEFFPERKETNDVRSPISTVTEQPKLEANSTVYHPSVLAIMEYEDVWPSDKNDERKLILERIIYALAYWNGVNVQLRPIENPWIRLRLAGIIIGRDRDDNHHLFELSNGKEFIHYKGTLERMGEYWGKRMRNKVEFRRGTFNIVALMTNYPGRRRMESTVGSSFPNGLLCDRDILGSTGVLITSDDLDFAKHQQVVGKLARMLGHGTDNNPACNYRSDWNGRAWNKCDLDSIRKSLVSDGWCMENAMGFNDPGKAVPTILPGMLTSLDQQCKRSGWRLASVCEEWTCKELVCRNNAYASCLRKLPAMDGSECGEKMICHNGECVRDTILSRS